MHNSSWIVCVFLFFVLSVRYSFSDFRSPFWIALIWMGFGYPLGKMLGVLVIGPRFFRWYLDDICFIAWGVFMFWVVFFASRDKKPNPRIMAESAFFFFFVAVAVELIQLFGNDHLAKAHSQARGDWMDIVCYVVGLIIVLALITLHAFYMDEIAPRKNKKIAARLAKIKSKKPSRKLARQQ